MAALSSLNAGAENYLMGWPANSNQLEEMNIWNGLGGEENGSPNDADMIYNDDIASVLVTAFANSERSNASVPSSDDEYLLYSEDQYGLLQPERFLNASNVDAYISDPISEDGSSPASDLIDADILRLAPTDVEERESPNNYSYGEFRQQGKSSKPLPPSSLFPFMEPCPKQTRFSSQWQSDTETSTVMNKLTDSSYIQPRIRQAVQMGGGGKANQGQSFQSIHRRTDGHGNNWSFFRQAPSSVSSSHSHHPDSVYPQQQIRMQRQMGAQYHDPRIRSKTQQAQYSINTNSSSYCQRKRQIGMDLNFQKVEGSMEATVLQQLESTIKNMNLANRCLIRDSFYRLAKGAKERQIDAYRSTAPKYSSSQLSASTCGAPEMETNAFDRWMVNLVFHRK